MAAALILSRTVRRLSGMSGETVSWWVGRGVDPAVFQRNFVDRNRDLPLRVDYLGADSPERTLAALADGTGPDIVMIPRAGTFRQLAREGRFADLTDYGWTARILPAALELGSHGGRVYGIPRSSETMLLLFDNAMLPEPPTSLKALSAVAGRMLRDGIVPFAAGCADVPQSVELYFSLVVNHHAGPAAVRDALDGNRPWTSFAGSMDLLRGWFDDGWFGDAFFTSTFREGFSRIATGEAGMSPNMTWVFGDIPDDLDLGVAPFPSLSHDVPSPLYLFGTGSLLAVNATSAHPDLAAAVLDRVLTETVRRDFSRELPGDWNVPLLSPDASGLYAATTPQFAATSVALTEAVAGNRFGYTTWSHFPPAIEAAVIAGFRDMVEGRLTIDAYLSGLDQGS